MDAKFISRTRLPDWLRSLAARFEVLAPAREGSAVLYRPVDPAAPPRQPELALQPVESAKRALFPLSEPLMTFSKSQPAGKPALQLREAPAPRPCLVFGLPSCDARGFLAFDPVCQGGGPAGKLPDNYYLRRREQAVLIVKTCPRPLSTCFCNWVGGGPASPEGADALATELQDGLLLEPLSGKGALALDSILLRPAVEAQLAEAAQNRAEAQAAMPDPVDLNGCALALRSKFDDAGFWRDRAAPCLSCGACTYLCPTCYCFDISDEERGSRGVRLRSWDSCMLPLFTQEAGGRNPRADKAARLRNRVSHKFSFHPSLHPTSVGQDGQIACCGCGRCLKSCPSAVDIRRIVTDALGLTGNKGCRPTLICPRWPPFWK
jgi:ferredoxin